MPDYSGTYAQAVTLIDPATGLAYKATGSGTASFSQSNSGTGVAAFTPGKYIVTDASNNALKFVIGDSAGTAIGPTNPLYTKQAAQTSATDTLQNQAIVNGNGAVGAVDGYGDLALLIQNGAGTCTVTVQGSLDSAFLSPQDALTLGVVKASDSAAGTVVNRVLASGAIAVAPNTSYLYVLADVLPYIRAVVSGANSLGAGTSDTGCTVKLYRLPI